LLAYASFNWFLVDINSALSKLTKVDEACSLFSGHHLPRDLLLYFNSSFLLKFIIGKVEDEGVIISIFVLLN